MANIEEFRLSLNEHRAMQPQPRQQDLEFFTPEEGPTCSDTTKGTILNFLYKTIGLTTTAIGIAMLVDGELNNQETIDLLIASVTAAGISNCIVTAMQFCANNFLPDHVVDASGVEQLLQERHNDQHIA